MNGPSHYDILGVPRTASLTEIRDAYLRLISIHHPDKNLGDPNATKRTQALNEAYDILKSTSRKNNYDLQLESIDASKERPRHQNVDSHPRPNRTSSEVGNQKKWTPGGVIFFLYMISFLWMIRLGSPDPWWQINFVIGVLIVLFFRLRKKKSRE